MSFISFHQNSAEEYHTFIGTFIFLLILISFGVTVLADNVRLPSVNNHRSDGLLSPLHSIFDFDGSDTNSALGIASQPLHAFLFSFTMIIISELGDKTFLIAALMAMRHPRGVVFSAAFASLLVMTVLSAALGHAVPHLSISLLVEVINGSTA